MKRSGESRRAKLFYLRDRVGKATRLTEKRKGKKEEGAAADGEARVGGFGGLSIRPAFQMRMLS